MADETFDFARAWDDVKAARQKRLPRTATNVLARIETAAISARKWPDAVRAFVQRSSLERSLQDDRPEDWLPAFAAHVDAAPREIQGPLQLHLAHVYREFSQPWRWGGRKPTLLDAAVATNRPPWSPERIQETLERQFQKVLAHAEVLKACPVSDWSSFLERGNMPESCRPTLFDVLVHDMLDFHGETIPDRTLEKGLALLNRLLLFHASDTNLDALADAELSRLRYIHSFEKIPASARDAKYAAALQSFVRAYRGKTDVVALAVHAQACLHRQAGALKRAHDCAAEGAREWPESVGGRLCRGLMLDLERKEFSLETERTWCAAGADLAITAKNMTNIVLKLVPIDFETLRDKDLWGDNSYYRTKAEEVCKKALKRILGARTWSVPLSDLGDYAFHTTRVSAPHDLKTGHYLLFAALDDDFAKDDKPVFVNTVTVTELALTVSAHEGRLWGRLFRAVSGEPVPDAEIEYWSTEQRKWVKTLTLQTATNGTFSLDRERLYGYVRAVAGKDEVLSLGTVGTGIPHPPFDLLDHIDLITDRSIYRPGQTISFKGIAYHADPQKRDFRVLPGQLVVIDFMDPNGKPVKSAKITTTPWGSFQGEMTAPTDRLTGLYHLKTRLVPTKAGDRMASADKSISVEEYKRPKFSATLESTGDVAALGVRLPLKGRARTYSGLPVQGAKVAWRVKRSTHYPSWWSWFGATRGTDDDALIAEGTGETDAEGNFALAFVPEADPTADLSGEPVFRFRATAVVTDGTGEAREAEMSFSVGVTSWQAQVWAQGNWLTPDRPVAVEAMVSTHADAAVQTTGLLRVFALTPPERVVRKPLEWSRGMSANGVGTGKSDTPWEWRSWKTGEEVRQVEIATGTNGIWKGELKLPPGAYRLVLETRDPQGHVVHAYDTCHVFDPSSDAARPKVPDFYRLESSSVKVGEKIRLFWASGYETGTCRIRLRQNGQVLFEEQTDSARPSRFVEFPVTEANRGEILVDTEFFRENRLYRGHDCVSVPWDDKYLKIEAEHLTQVLEPGRKETWTFRVKAEKKGDPVAAEVLAFMYDKSLDAIRGHWARTSFSSYFSPPIRSLWEPQFQNTCMNSYRLCGHFPGGGWSPEATWPKVKNLGSGYAANEYFAFGGMKMKSARGRIGADECALAAAAPRAEAAVEACAVMEEAAEAPEPEGGAEPEVSIRSNLQETAFFLPHLETDADGRVAFSFTVPDALTGWKFFAVAHDRELRSGNFMNDGIVTRKTLMVEPNAPRFVREGDDFRLAVKVTNTIDEPQRGVVSLLLEDAETGRPADVGGGTLPFELAGHESKSYEFRVRIPEGQGYLKYTAKAKSASFGDGEEGWLPVLSRRILVREAVQLQVRGAGTREFALSNLLTRAESGTIRSVDLTVRAVSRPAWYAVLALPYLMEYPHECCEQTFSRYYANVLGAYVANLDPQIRKTFDAWKQAGAEALKSPLETNERLKTIALDSTPWVREAKHETAARGHLGALFDTARLDRERRRCLNILEENLTGGMWPWFPGGRPSEGVTLYILTGLARLSRITGEPRPAFFNGVCTALDREVREDVRRRRRAEYAPFRLNGFDIRWLYLHSFAEVPKPDEETRRFLCDLLRREWTDLGIELQAVGALVLHRTGCRKEAKEILASLKERAIVSDEMGMYWKRGSFYSSSIFAAPVSMQAAVIEAFHEITRDASSLDACRAWMLKQKQTQNWSSTVSTADAVYALFLGGGTKLLAGGELATVTLGGVEVPKENAEEGTGLYSHRYEGRDIRPEMGRITFTSDGSGGVAWGGVNWSYFEDVEKVRAHEPRELHVEKKYYRKIHTPEGVRLAAVEGTLERGDELVVRLVIRSDRVYEYVHLQDERPSCAEPMDVLSSYRWRDGVGFYQSTRDTATHYYIDRLGKGEFTLETSFRVQQPGTFAGGLATIQCMYAPEFTAHSAAERIVVRPDDRK